MHRRKLLGGRRRGRGFFDFLRKAHDFIKSNKIISRIGSLIPHPAARAIGTAAGALGYGRRRRVHRRRAVGGRRRVHRRRAIGGRRRVGRPRIRRRRAIGGRRRPALDDADIN
jgi:hypothetical protein